jgi:hypothetical protein
VSGSSGIATTPDFTATGGSVGSSSSTANIVLNNNTMTLNSTTLQSSGELTIAPRTIDTTIGIAGYAGTLQIPTSYFATNFANGFSNITVGRSDGTGRIAAGTFSPSDNLTLKSANGIDFYGALTAGTNTVTLNSTGSVAESGSGAITAANLSLLGGGTYSLSGANDIDRLTTTAGSVSFTDIDGIDVGASTLTSNLNVTTGGAITQTGALSVAGTTTLTAGANDITLTDTANSFTGAVSVVLGQNVSLTNASATVLNSFNVSGNLALASTGNVTQSAAIFAPNLLLSGSGNYTLNNSSNTIGTLSADGLGSLNFVNSGAFSIGATGIVNATGAISLATLTGDLTITGNIKCRSIDLGRNVNGR